MGYFNPTTYQQACFSRNMTHLASARLSPIPEVAEAAKRELRASARLAALQNGVSFRINLKVPYTSRREASAIGARFDPEARVWFVRPLTPLGPYQQWLSEDHLEQQMQQAYAAMRHK